MTTSVTVAVTGSGGLGHFVYVLVRGRASPAGLSEVCISPFIRIYFVFNRRNLKTHLLHCNFDNQCKHIITYSFSKILDKRYSCLTLCSLCQYVVIWGKYVCMCERETKDALLFVCRCVWKYPDVFVHYVVGIKCIKINFTLCQTQQGAQVLSPTRESTKLKCRWTIQGQRLLFARFDGQVVPNCWETCSLFSSACDQLPVLKSLHKPASCVRWSVI